MDGATVTVSQDMIAIVDVTTGARLGVLPLDSTPTPDPGAGSQFVGAARGLVARRTEREGEIWDTHTSSIVRRFGRNLLANDVTWAFSPDNRNIVEFTHSQFRVWDLDSAVTPGFVPHVSLDLILHPPLISPDGRRFAGTPEGAGGNVVVCDLATGAAHETRLAAVHRALGDWSPDGGVLALVNDGVTLEFLRVSDGALVQLRCVGDNTPSCVANTESGVYAGDGPALQWLGYVLPASRGATVASPAEIPREFEHPALVSELLAGRVISPSAAQFVPPPELELRSALARDTRAASVSLEIVAPTPERGRRGAPRR